MCTGCVSQNNSPPRWESLYDEEEKYFSNTVSHPEYYFYFTTGPPVGYWMGQTLWIETHLYLWHFFIFSITYHVWYNYCLNSLYPSYIFTHVVIDNIYGLNTIRIRVSWGNRYLYKSKPLSTITLTLYVIVLDGSTYIDIHLATNLQIIFNILGIPQFRISYIEVLPNSPPRPNQDVELVTPPL